MIQSLRDSASSLPFKILLVVICASFALFGIGGGGGVRQGQVANIAGEDISQRDFQIEYRNFLFQRNLENLTPELEQTVKTMVLGQMIEQRLLTQEAEKMGFHSSEARIRETIKEGFFGDQPFDFEIYRNVVRNRMGKTTAKFEEMQGDRIEAALMSQWFGLTSVAPDQEVRNAYQLQNKKRNLVVVPLTDETIQASTKVGQPSQSQLEDFFQANASSYVVPEKRKISVLIGTKEDSTEEENAYFDRMQTKWALVQKDKNLALSTLAQEDPQALLTQTDWVTYGDRIEKVDPQDTALILNATRSLERNERSTVLHGRNGDKVYLVQLEDVQASRPATLAEVREEVINAWQAEQRKEKAQTYAQSLMETWKNSTKSPTELAKAKGLKAVDTGMFTYAANGTIPEVGQSKVLINQAFAQAQPGWLDQVFTIDGTPHLAFVKEVEQPDWTSFQSQKEALAFESAQEMNNLKQYLWIDDAREKANVQQIDVSAL